MTEATYRPRHSGAALAQKDKPHRLIGKEPIPEAFRRAGGSSYRMDLAEILPATAIEEIKATGRMSIHCIGDSGGVKRPESQSLVADGMERSAKNPSTSPVRFCYHLGDVVYYTGEVADYWDQFYAPYEHYPLDIVAIPGNHDGERLTEQSQSLQGFYENFLAPGPKTFTRESRDSFRPAMYQPYFYWTLTTPLVTFIGLYTNVPEHGWIDDAQRAWFHAEMKAADPAKALVVCCHHPIYSFDSHHAGSPTMAKELEDAINESHRVPNMVLSAHVHDYQRIELKTGAHTIPFFVIGNSGYWHLHHIAAAVGYQDPDTEAKLMSGVDSHHGFMTFEFGRTIINGNFTTVPRPQESWSDPKAYDMKFDVFSYTARPMFLAKDETITLVPTIGGHLPPHHGHEKPAGGQGAEKGGLAPKHKGRRAA